MKFTDDELSLIIRALAIFEQTLTPNNDDAKSAYKLSHKLLDIKSRKSLKPKVKA